MTSLQQAYSFFKISESRPCFLIKGEMIGDLQNAVQLPDEKQSFTIHRIILISVTSIILLEKDEPTSSFCSIYE